MQKQTNDNNKNNSLHLKRKKQFILEPNLSGYGLGLMDLSFMFPGGKNFMGFMLTEQINL